MSDVHDAENDHLEKSRAPLLEHLTELRNRLIISLAALFVAFIVSFFFSRQIFLLLVHPYQVAEALRASEQAGLGPFQMILALVGLADVGPLKPVVLIITAPLEQFFANLKISAFSAVALAFPVIAYQLYRFIAPGLYKRERKAFLPFLVASPLLFILGAALVYFVMLPFVMWFSLNTQTFSEGVSVQLMPKVADYLVLATRLLLAFGICFQLPVVLTLGGMAGFVSTEMLRKGRRYAIVAIFVLAAIVTPPDPISQIALALPLILLYEVSIWCVLLVQRKREKELVAEDMAGNAL